MVCYTSSALYYCQNKNVELVSAVGPQMILYFVVLDVCLQWQESY